jgi:hypothetical protein
VELDVENTCSDDMNVLVQRDEISMVPGSSSAFCWLVCFDTVTSLSPFPLTVPANSTIADNFSGHYRAWGNEGVSTISYEFFEEGNPGNSVMVTVNYDCTLMDVAENVKHDENSVNIYPIPAKNNITVDFDAMYSHVDFQIIDITGSKVKEIKQVQNGSTIRINDLSEGLYLYRAFTEGNLIKTGRLIINR